MALRDAVVRAGLSATAAAAGCTQGTGATNLAAAGASQTTAAPIPADVADYTTVGAGQGVILPNANAGDSGTIFNGQATNALLVYPPVGGSINRLGVNASYSIAVATPAADWYCVVPGLFVISQSA